VSWRAPNDGAERRCAHLLTRTDHWHLVAPADRQWLGGEEDGEREQR